MIDELDTVICNHTETRRPPRGAPLPVARRASSRSPEGPEGRLRCAGRPMADAALRVLETTWQVWREPLA